MKVKTAFFAGWFVLLMIGAAITSGVGQKRAITVEDLWAMGRIGDLRLSPDGRWIAYTVTFYSMEENKGNTDIWLISTEGGQPRRLTTSPAYDGHPTWSPDSRKIAFISSRDGKSQIYVISLEGGEAQKMGDIPTEVTGVEWSADGTHLAFTTRVYPDAPTLQQTAARDAEKARSPVKARLIDRLLFRYWNHWLDEKRRHVFIMPIEADTLWDITPGDYDSPPIDLGSHRDYAFSPDGQEVAFVRNVDPVVALSTNNDIFLVPVTGGKPRNITASNKANDNQPVYSPDGRYIAYRAMRRPGFESDQYDLWVYERATGKRRNLTPKFDRSVGEIVWSPDSRTIYFNAYNEGRCSIYAVSVEGMPVKGVPTKGVPARGQGTGVRQLVYEHFNTRLAISPDGQTLYFCQQAINRPYEIFAYDLSSGAIRQLTFTNQELLAELEMNPAEYFWFKSYDGTPVHGLLLKPPFFDPSRKYPLVYLIHGGPQGMWGDVFHYRWNAQMFASPGYVVAMVNFRGSRGYGQKFCDAVSKNWGGGPYRDLMAGLDYLLKTFDFIDEQKLAAAGASYGGFMINWIAGHTGRFKCLVSHAGVFDQMSMYGATEELWFPEWEFDGNPYERPRLYDRWSPSRYAKNFKKYRTPTLVIHGERDFRVPYTQGLQMFTALQRMGVPSKLLFFPDEDHFVTKPQNARLWWKTVLGWMDQWISK